MTQKILRSALFVPGSRPEFLPKAEAAKPDAIILDLEDSVAEAGKERARATVKDALLDRADRLTLVRVNHPAKGMIDQDVAVLGPYPSQAVVVPKVESLEEIEPVGRALSDFEQASGLAPNSIGILVAIESARGLRALFDVLHNVPRVRGAALATAEEGDLLADLGGRWTPSGDALSYSRGKFVCDARAAGTPWILDGAFMAIGNREALERESLLARTYGFTGKIAIHPTQVAVINAAFSPTVEEIDRARRMIAAFRDAQSRGLGAIKFEGMMVDYANARIAEQILSLA